MNDFPSATQEAWSKRVAASLKDGSFEEKLVSTSADGFRIAPLYGQETGPRAERQAASPWTRVQRVDHGDAARANGQILDDLNNGATGLTLCIAGAPAARGFGLADASAVTLARALADVALHAITVRLDAGPAAPAAARGLSRLVRDRALNPELLALAFGIDPIGTRAQSGAATAWQAETAALAADLASDFRGPFLEADGRAWHDAGATPGQEIGAMLATAAAYLRSIDKADDGVAAGAIGATLSADQDMFMTMAKFRALRILWERLFAACGLTARLHLHGETSWRMMTRLDPHTNILRVAAAIFAAGPGGADSLCALPFSLAQGLPNSFARRVARNAQNLLIEEAQLWRVSDAAAGAGYIEHLTQSLCDRGWDFFQTIERQGGIEKSLDSGWLQGEIARARDEMTARKLPIIGTSNYRLAKEYEAAVEQPAPDAPPSYPQALAPMRLAEAMERA